MQVVIMDGIGNKEKYENAHVPRVGDKILWVFAPASVVVEVMIDYKGDRAFVVVD